jgi:small GTP-binding protein
VQADLTECCRVALGLTDELAVGQRVLKIVLLGDYSVGKTAIAKRYLANSFDHEYRPSIGIDILSRRIDLGHDQVQLQIWDMSGQTEFRRLRQQYLEATDSAVIIFDLTRRSSLDAVPSWVEEAREFNPKLPTVLVGNKADATAARAITEKEATGLAKSLRMLFYIETSAKSGDNVDEVFQAVAKALVASRKRGPTRKTVSATRRPPKQSSRHGARSNRRSPSTR